jgi:photosynthetic reaction center cytochrome c subunit
MKNIVLFFSAVAFVLLTAAMLLTAGWTAPPIHSTQGGFRGLSMGQLSTPRSERLLKEANKLPEGFEKASATGERATAVYQNVQVLKDLSADQFNRVMLAMAAWVAPPDQGCAYCHNVDKLSDDSLYTKRVARRMLEMTRHINEDWKGHVAATGVTCYTCHRGNPVPANIWFNEPPPRTGGAAATNDGFGHPTKANGSTAMSGNPFAPLDDKTSIIRIVSTNALPQAPGPGSMPSTYQNYALMIAISNSLGVNCTFCHNSRSFMGWSESTPQRVTAYHGIQMVRDLNAKFLEPLKSELPAQRLGPMGDGPKTYCATCHQGASKPLLGVSMAKDWPELGGAASQ